MCIAWVILRFRDSCTKKKMEKVPRISMEYFEDPPVTEYTTLVSKPLAINHVMYSESAVPILHSV